ncbi:hypothetical protein TSUD_292500 [Trifolium subterraneum]|uniref:Transmembrane protein n=1 Tax=Trifolium subterraneum TaxID=3900 RepID=A0A2Z6N1G5_TRISU|nr:hypothetical protein TSUD_292500 [Trifolium subterraneum]
MLLFCFAPIWGYGCGSGLWVRILLLFFRRERWVGEDLEVWCAVGVDVAVASIVWSYGGCKRF